VHIKFLDHGKGSPDKASAYLLDTLDHLGNIRAGIDVLMGDATTFNAICNASPHLWKYTSGVIAWSKNDAPTDQQIQEVLNDFEQHAFAGLDPSQYHLFAVQHTDHDGSKHLHVLTPRIDLNSGKSLNIAPPGHEKHFDALRDDFNKKYQWSCPDDLLLMQTTQEPNHIAKLNKHAENILSSQDIENLTKKQFCKAIDNYVQTLLRTQTAENRTDIVRCIQQLNGIDSIKPSKNFLTVTLNNGKKHRLKGDFYNEDFEIRSYTEHLRTTAENRPTPDQITESLKDASQLRATYRAKRAAYHEKHHAFARSTAHDNHHKIASELDFNRDREFIGPRVKIAVSELYSANRDITSSTCSYRYCRNLKNTIQHRFVFNVNSHTTARNQQPITEHFNRPAATTNAYPSPSQTSNLQPSATDRERNPHIDQREIGYTESDLHPFSNDCFGSADAFNHYLSSLSSQYQSKHHRSTTGNHSIQLKSDHQSDQRPEQSTEIKHENRNRPTTERTQRIIESTKQLTHREEQGLNPTNQFIEKHFDRLQRIGATARKQNQRPKQRETSPAIFDFSDEIRAFKTRTEQFLKRATASLASKLENSIQYAIRKSFETTRFKQHCERLRKNRIETDSNSDWQPTNRTGASTLENLAIRSTEHSLRKFRDARTADQYARGNCGELNRVNQELGQLETIISKIRLKPIPTNIFDHLRYDGYYPDYVIRHKELCEKQQQAYRTKDKLKLIEHIAEKTSNLEKYIHRARKDIFLHDYDQFLKIIKNDQRMLKYLQCEQVLEIRNHRAEEQKRLYQECLIRFESIKKHIDHIKNPSPQLHSSTTDPIYTAKPKPIPKPQSSFGIDDY
jgi:hypothetical protein